MNAGPGAFFAGENMIGPLLIAAGSALAAVGILSINKEKKRDIELLLMWKERDGLLKVIVEAGLGSLLIYAGALLIAFENLLF